MYTHTHIYKYYTDMYYTHYILYIKYYISLCIIYSGYVLYTLYIICQVLYISM